MRAREGRREREREGAKEKHQRKHEREGSAHGGVHARTKETHSEICVCVHVQRGECDRIATKLQASKRVGISMMSVTGTFSLIFFLLSCQI